MPKIKENEYPKTIMFAADVVRDETTAKCSGVAYSGGTVNYYGEKFIVDLKGLEIAQQIPILYNHNNSPAFRLGIANIANDGQKLTFNGEIDSESEIGKWLTTTGKKWKWQVSIGFNVNYGDYKYVDEVTKTEINGNEVTDCLIAVKSKLREISLVAVGADDKTSMEINMSLDNYMQFSAENQPLNKGKQTMADNKENKTPEVPETPKTPEVNFDAKLQELENKFNAKIGDLEKKNAAIEAENVKLKEANKTLEENAKRPMPNFNFGNTEVSANDVLEAALSPAFGVKIDNKDNKAHEVAEKKFRGGISLKDAVFLAAKACGYTSDIMRTDADIYDALNTIKLGFTNINLPIVLGNLINKRIKDGFTYVESVWREIADIITVNDFRDVYTCRLTAGGEFEEIPAGGKIPMGGPVEEEYYSVKAKTYGMRFALDRQTIRNDAGNDIASKAFQFGRKGALKINDIFWSIFLNNSNFFKNDNNNIVTSAGELSITALSNLVAKFDAQTDKNGAPIGIDASILLVPPALETIAYHLFNDREIRNNTANKEYFINNPWAGKFRPVKSRYLANTKYTGYSADDYYLLADPKALPVIQLAFLDGKDTPYIESSAAEFDTLGIVWRGYFDFGATLADPKGGVKGDKA